MSSRGPSGACAVAVCSIRSAVAHAPDGPRDDIAVVVLQAATEGPARGLEGSVQMTAESAGEGLQLRLGGGVEAPARARAALAGLAGRVGAEALWSARLLVTELVTNSVRHGGAGDADGWIALEVELLADTLRVAVRDRGPGFDPAPRPPHQVWASGRGLFLVDKLADRWGASEGGNCVWFELDRGERTAA